MIKLKDPLTLQRAVRAISNFISEGNFRLNDKGISFKAIDPSQVVLVEYLLPKSLFDEFKIEPSFIGLDVDEFNRVLKRAFPNDTLELNLDDHSLHVRFRSSLDRNFKLSLMDVSETEQDFPDHAFDVAIEINAHILQEALKDAAVFASSVVFTVENNAVVLSAKGTNGSIDCQLKDSAKIKSAAGKTKSLTSKYSLSFLENIVKEAAPESTISLEFSHEAPVKITYPIGKTEIHFYLAHMIL